MIYNATYDYQYYNIRIITDSPEILRGDGKLRFDFIAEFILLNLAANFITSTIIKE